jgi:hypothetical protein
MAAGASALNFVLILFGILLRLTPERAPRTVLRYERPANLGFYAIITKMTEVLFVTFGQNMVFLYRYGCTSQVRSVIAKITL